MRRFLSPLLALALLLTLAVPGSPQVARGAEYTLETLATYDVRPDDGEISVAVEVTFTNTTPDPSGQFSVFDEIKLAVHDGAAEVAATDDDGDLDVNVESEDDVNVATVELRDELRFEDEATLELTYTLPDSDDPQLRVRPSLVVFPAWGFGTASEVRVLLPTGYEVRVDGDALTEEGAELVSDPIEDPAQWLALVTAVRPAEYASFDATVPLTGGTADVVVRAFADDEAWGERTLDLLTRALPAMEEEIGLPYPRIGQLIFTESVSTDGSGFAEEATGGTEILVAFDQPEFTVLHQLAHVWLSPALIESRWIREGLASHVAERLASSLEVETPYDPAARIAEIEEPLFPLDAWSADAGPEGEAFGYAASWALAAEIEEIVGADALRAVLARVAASVGPYQGTDIEPDPGPEGVAAPSAPLTTRAFLDHLEAISRASLSDLFAERVLTAEDAQLLPARAEARDAFDALVADAGDWGAPDPILGAMTAWSFDDARAQIDAAAAWLDERDVLLDEMGAEGLAAPERLRQQYRSYGGGPEAVAELEAERTVVETYRATATDVTGERSFIERIGLIGGPDPTNELNRANGRFADGDLRGSLESLAEAQSILASGETGGIVRLASAALLALILLGLAVLLLRRRASYTAAR
ncbi:MAG: hypothetical protein ACR2I5_00895 [Candidatus Limnocylindria bacterium]